MNIKYIHCSLDTACTVLYLIALQDLLRNVELAKGMTTEN